MDDSEVLELVEENIAMGWAMSIAPYVADKTSTHKPIYTYYFKELDLMGSVNRLFESIKAKHVEFYPTLLACIRQECVLIRTTHDDSGSINTKKLRLVTDANDLFRWGCSETVELPENNMQLLEKAIADCGGDLRLGASLYGCRIKKQQPQGPYYSVNIPKELQPLFKGIEG